MIKHVSIITTILALALFDAQSSNVLVKASQCKIAKPHLLDVVTPVTGVQKIILGYLESFEGASRTMHEQHDNGVCSIAITPNGKFVVSSNQGNNWWSPDIINIWHKNSCTCFKMLTGHHHCFAVTGDSKYLITGGGNGQIAIFDFSQGVYISCFKAPDERSHIQKIAVSNDNKFIVLATSLVYTRGYPLYLVDFKTGDLLRKLDGEFPNISSLIISKDNVVAACTHTGDINKWDLATGNIVCINGLRDTTCAVLSSDKRFRAFAYRDNIVCRVNGISATDLKTIGQHTVSIRSVAISPDGNYILSGTESGGIAIWNSETGERVLYLQRQLSAWEKLKFFVSAYLDVTAMAMSPDNRFIAAGYSDGGVTLWITQAEEIRTAGS